jgi:mannose-6-phosphate isomerase-like protein (cupin superfamily)
MIYVIKGSGKIYVGDSIFQVTAGDVVDVPPGNKFACAGKDFEYITFDVPAFYPEQSEIIIV